VHVVVQEVYSHHTDNAERKAEIYSAFAALFLQNLYVVNRDGKLPLEEDSRKVVEYLRKSEELMPLNEYTWLIKGFYELALGNTEFAFEFNNLANSMIIVYKGETKRAEDNFRAVHDRSSKVGKRRFLFGASIGLVSCRTL
jgi:hypothetical protein